MAKTEGFYLMKNSKKFSWKKFETGDLLVVYWRDITATEGWVPRAEAEISGLLECTTVGYLLNQDKDSIRLVSTVCSNETSNLAVIPKAVIYKVKKAEYDR